MTRRLLVAFTLCASALGAQESLLPSTGGGMGFSLSGWHFAKPIPQAGGDLADVAEVSLPIRVRATFGRWSFDLSGAGAFGAAHFTVNSQGSGNGNGNGNGDGGDRLTTIAGPTDVKLRLSGPVVGDNWLATLGLTVPSGKISLDGDETSTLQAISAPSLHMPVASLGTGAGATVGLIRAFQGDDWAVAVGGSFEQRTEYSPVAIAIASGKAETKVTPGSAIHGTLGIDRTLGENHWSGLVVADVFSKDQVKLVTTGVPTTATSYQLGPQLTLTSQYEFGGATWREAEFNVAARMRSEFSDSLGKKVSGSSGNYVEASLGGVRGGANGMGLLIGVDGRWHSGLKFTDALVGAAVTAVGGTIGFERAGESTMTRFYIHGQFGSFDTGTIKTTGMGATIGFSVYGRRDAR